MRRASEPTPAAALTHARALLRTARDPPRARAACAARGATSRCSSSPTPSGPNRSTTCSSATTCPTGPSWARAPDRRTVSRRTRANARGAPSTLGARSCRMTIGSEPRGETTRRLDGRRSGGARPNQTPPRARGRRIVVLSGTAPTAALHASDGRRSAQVPTRAESHDRRPDAGETTVSTLLRGPRSARLRRHHASLLRLSCM